ncbi:MAG: septum formation protein Maf [Deltaproteobacteria bacterium]|nr:septum formation protein Maf [Deltaproteobacteria bacterium]
MNSLFKEIDGQNPLILASASPRRKRLLEQACLPFEIVVSRIREEATEGLAPADLCLGLAREKAMDVSSRIRPSWILGADTIVVLGDRILGKPADRQDALNMLSLLSGKVHRVITGFCILTPSGIVAHVETVSTSVTVKELGGDERKAYVDTGEPFGKAGGYAIQGIGSFMVESISGSYTNVVGLPLCAVIKALRKAGALEKFP